MRFNLLLCKLTNHKLGYVFKEQIEIMSKDNFPQMQVREALNSALDEEMAADPKVFLMGEEVREN